MRHLPRLLLLAGFAAGSVLAAEAPMTETGQSSSGPVPVPSAAEAAHQDLASVEARERWLDEAVFTEISPFSVPEIGIALPPDQQD